MRDDEDEPFRSRLWRAITDVMHEQEIAKEKVRTMENIVERQGRWSEDVVRMHREINDKLEINSIRLVEALKLIELNRKDIDRLWAFPVKFFSVVISIGGAFAVVWHFANWMLSQTAIEKLPR